jgi:hypothetical protein
MRRSGARTVLACAFAALAACKLTGSPADEPPPAGADPPPAAEAPVTGSEPEVPPALPGDRPAIIVNPTPESHAELERVVSDMLFGAKVTLSKDVFTESSVLVVERRRIEGLGHPPLTGRDLGRPERFRLLTDGTTCVLTHESNGARYELPLTDCGPEP